MSDEIFCLLRVRIYATRYVLEFLTAAQGTGGGLAVIDVRMTAKCTAVDGAKHRRAAVP